MHKKESRFVPHSPESSKEAERRRFERYRQMTPAQKLHMVVVNAAAHGFRATFRCLRDVEMDFTSPEDGKPSPFIAMVGPNGAGKTTVLEAIALTILHVVRFSLGGRISAISRDDEMIVLRLGEQYLVHQQGGVGFLRPGDPLPRQLAQDLGRVLYLRSGYLPMLPFGVPLQQGPASGMDIGLALLPQDMAGVQQRVAVVHQWWLHLHWEYPKTTTLDRLWGALKPFLGALVSTWGSIQQITCRGSMTAARV